jgi:WhiB family redox-sensing transcriptional regulator
VAENPYLPTPVAENWDWQIRAACRGLSASVFFHPENERGPSRRRREQGAKAVCAQCPVVRDCLNWALEMREPYGVWGGKSVPEREEMLAATVR